MFPALLSVTDYFPQEPRAALGLIDPVFNQAGRRDIVVLFADFMRGAQESRQFPVVGMKLSKHVLRGGGFAVVVFQALVLCDVTNGVKRGPAEFSRSLGNIVRHIKDLLCVFIEQNVVIAEVAPSHVPVEIFRLEIEREYVGKQRPKLARYLRDTVAAEAAGDFRSVCSSGLCLNCACTIFCHCFGSPLFYCILDAQVLRLGSDKYTINASLPAGTYFADRP